MLYRGGQQNKLSRGASTLVILLITAISPGIPETLANKSDPGLQWLLGSLQMVKNSNGDSSSFHLLSARTIFWCGCTSMTTTAIGLGTESRMSLVRMCMVTVTLFRVSMCMCLRARERERIKRSDKAAKIELLPTLGICNDGYLEQAEHDPRRSGEHSQFSLKPRQLLVRQHLPPVQSAGTLESIVGPFSPKRMPVECKECLRPLQEEFLQRQLRMGLRWLSNNIGERYREFLDRVQKDALGQVEPGVVLEGGELSPHITRPSPTVAWSECDSRILESPSCTAHRRVSQRNYKMEVATLDDKVKTLVDEFLGTDKRPLRQEDCLTNFGDSGQCSHLPNQIETT